MRECLLCGATEGVKSVGMARCTEWSACAERAKQQRSPRAATCFNCGATGDASTLGQTFVGRQHTKGFRITVCIDSTACAARMFARRPAVTA